MACVELHPDQRGPVGTGTHILRVMAVGRVILNRRKRHIARIAIGLARAGTGPGGHIPLVGQVDLVAFGIGDQIQEPARDQGSDAGLVVVLQRISGAAKFLHDPVGQPDAEAGRIDHLANVDRADIRIDLGMRFGGGVPEDRAGKGLR